MNIDARLLVALLIGLAGVLMLVAVAKKQFKTKGVLRMTFLVLGFVFVAHSLVSIGGQLDWWTIPSSASSFFLSAGLPSEGTVTCPSGFNLVNGACISSSGVTTFQPTASYSSKDKFSTLTIPGTAYYKVNDMAFTSTAQTNVDNGDSITYWIDNSTYYVQPASKVASGVTQVEAIGVQNGSASITLYDLVGRADAGNGVSNVSMGANDVANIEVTVVGTAKKSIAPFGGVMVVEYNSTISSLTCTGDALSDSNPYHLTYTVSGIGKTSKQYAFTSALDDGTASVKKITCQFQNGGTAAGAGTSYKFLFYPANYYRTNAGNVVLDTEQFANDATTLTGYGSPNVIGYWAA